MDHTIGTVISELTRVYPKLKTTLRFKTPFQLLIATMLSAQCTDERVNQVTKDLFKRLNKPEDFANIKLKDLETIIRSTGYYKLKAKRIRNASRMIVRKFNSDVPNNMKDLLSLDGVGRKTANIVLFVVFDKIDGIAVDTHVARCSRRLGWTKSKNPNRIETDLRSVISRDLWGEVSMLLILHGREICTSRKPRCEKCILKDMCPSAFRFNHGTTL